MRRDGVQVVGHRGAAGSAPENTLPAVALAVEHGADLVEIDVQLSSDRELILLHDDSLQRTTDVERVYGARRAAVARPGLFSVAELRRLDAGSWGRWAGTPFAGAHVPTLREVLELLEPHPAVGLLVEIKSPEDSPGVEAVLARELQRWRRNGAEHRLVVHSFDVASVGRFASAEEGLGVRAELGVACRRRIPLRRLAGLPPAVVQVNPWQRSVTPAYVAALHARALTTHPFTVNEPRRMRELVAMGVDGIVTDRPDVLRRLLDERPPVAADPPVAG